MEKGQGLYLRTGEDRVTDSELAVPTNETQPGYVSLGDSTTCVAGTMKRKVV